MKTFSRGAGKFHGSSTSVHESCRIVRFPGQTRFWDSVGVSCPTWRYVAIGRLLWPWECLFQDGFHTYAYIIVDTASPLVTSPDSNANVSKLRVRNVDVYAVHEFSPPTPINSLREWGATTIVRHEKVVGKPALFMCSLLVLARQQLTEKCTLLMGDKSNYGY